MFTWIDKKEKDFTPMLTCLFLIEKGKKRMKMPQSHDDIVYFILKGNSICCCQNENKLLFIDKYNVLFIVNA